MAGVTDTRTKVVVHYKLVGKVKTYCGISKCYRPDDVPGPAWSTYEKDVTCKECITRGAREGWG